MSFLDSYDIFDENGETIYTVEGKLAFGHCFHILDKAGNHIGTVKESVLAFLPRFDIYIDNIHQGSIRKEFTLFKPKFTMDFKDWQINGDFMEWEYSIINTSGEEIASVSKEIFNFTDTYSIDVKNTENALSALLVVIAIDAEKCSNR